MGVWGSGPKDTRAPQNTGKALLMRSMRYARHRAARCIVINTARPAPVRKSGGQRETPSVPSVNVEADVSHKPDGGGRTASEGVRHSVIHSHSQWQRLW